MLKLDRTTRRRMRNRRQIIASANGRPRLSVHRSCRYVYAQLIDDLKGETIVSASSLEPALRSKLKASGNAAAANEVGKLIAQKALKSGVTDVVFDRGSLSYHGCVKSLAEAAREAGLKF